MNLNYPFLDGFTVYTKSQCDYCDKTKVLLSEFDEDKNYIDCDDVLQYRYSKLKFLEHIQELSGQNCRRFPIIFYNSKFIGGY